MQVSKRRKSTTIAQPKPMMAPLERGSWRGQSADIARSDYVTEILDWSIRPKGRPSRPGGLVQEDPSDLGADLAEERRKNHVNCPQLRRAFEPAQQIAEWVTAFSEAATSTGYFERKSMLGIYIDGPSRAVRVLRRAPRPGCPCCAARNVDFVQNSNERTIFG